MSGTENTVSAQNLNWPQGKKLPVETNPPMTIWHIPGPSGRIKEVVTK